MATSNLTLKQRNQVGNLLEGRGIANDCELDAHASLVTHRPTESWFRFQYDFNGYETVWKVTDGPELEWPGPPGLKWGDVLTELDRWADEVNYVASAPDFWQELQASREAIAAVVAVDTGNAAFVPSELDAISNSFGAVKSLIRERYELPDEQLAAIDRKLDELAEASRTMGRKDWLTLVGNTGFTLIVGGLIPPDVVQNVLGLALRGIAHLFGVDLPPLAA